MFFQPSSPTCHALQVLNDGRATRIALPRTWPSIALTIAVRVSAACCGVPCGISRLMASAVSSNV
jgi:hypothetical protein